MKDFFDIKAAEKTLRDAGQRMTRQRMLILTLLQNNKEHPTADDIIQAILKKQGHVTVATVYNTLDVLTKHGLIQKIDGLETRSHYDPNSAPHFHAICRKCKKVFDIETDKNAFSAGDFTPETVLVQGICGKCRKETL